jgi:hypothetical protein
VERFVNGILGCKGYSSVWVPGPRGIIECRQHLHISAALEGSNTGETQWLGFLTGKLTLLHSSAYPNAADVITQPLEQFHLERLALPPYSLGLVSSNFHLIEEKCCRKSLQCYDEMNTAVCQWV